MLPTSNQSKPLNNYSNMPIPPNYGISSKVVALGYEFIRAVDIQLQKGYAYVNKNYPKLTEQKELILKVALFGVTLFMAYNHLFQAIAFLGAGFVFSSTNSLGVREVIPVLKEKIILLPSFEKNDDMTKKIAALCIPLYLFGGFLLRNTLTAIFFGLLGNALSPKETEGNPNIPLIPQSGTYQNGTNDINMLI